MINSYLFKKIVHIIFYVNFKDKCIKKLSKGIKNKKILEIGSGKRVNGKYIYSEKCFFQKSNKFITSDINQLYGHKIVDITAINYKNKYDLILCLNVLEHIFNVKKAIDNMYKLVKKGGLIVIYVPVFYPLHDEPNDYWRITINSFNKLLKKFKKVDIRHSGLKKYPFAYYIEATK